MTNSKVMGTFYIALFLFACSISHVSAYFEDYYDFDYEYDYSSGWEGADCIVDESGKEALNGTACDLAISGNDEISPKALPGGVTGTYKYEGCQNGRPFYKRDLEAKRKGDKGVKEAGDMWMIYSTYWGDWDFVNATTLSDQNVLGYGGQGFGEARPETVLATKWYVLKDIVQYPYGEDDFINTVELKVECVKADHPDGGSCTDGIMNGDETGVDCGGEICAPCVSYAEHQEAIANLKEKLRLEWEEEQRETEMTGVAKVVVVIIALVGAAIVCGGPLIFMIRKLRAGGSKNYAPLPVTSRPKAQSK